MSIIQGNVVSGGSQGYEIPQSLRFNDDDSAYLSRTPSVAGNQKTWTFSTWVKRGNLTGTRQVILKAGTGTTNVSANYLRFQTDDTLQWNGYTTSWRRTAQVFRDTSSWYHIVLAVDTTLATSSDRQKIYVNGVEITDFTDTNDMALNTDYSISNTVSHRIGIDTDGTKEFDGYLAETHFIDGQALTPDNFGEFDATYGHWKPIAYEGTYGTNGFYLDNSGLGTDVSGNSNNFTATNLATTDIVKDSPTNNFATLNPLDKTMANQIGINMPTFLEGNLRTAADSVNQAISSGTIGVSSGKWYFELNNQISANNADAVGFGNSRSNYALYRDNGHKIVDAADTNISGTTWQAAGDIVGITLDADTGVVSAYVNNVFVAVIDTLDMSNPVMPIVYNREATGLSRLCANFGQDSSFAGKKTPQGFTDANGIGDFYYEPPQGYLALCTANLPEPTVVPSEHFDVVTYTGDGTTDGSKTISGLSFQPDFIWLKERSRVNSHHLHDIVRGKTGTYYRDLLSNTTYGESTTDQAWHDAYGDLNTITADGFTVSAGTDSANTTYNMLNVTNVAWNWKAGGTPVTNTDGTITSQVSANVDAGFSIVGYTGNGVISTVGHGLNNSPQLVVSKRLNTTSNWQVDTNLIDGSMDYLYLNLTNAKANNTINSPTSSVFTTNTWTGDNIAYCFHSVEGYSKIGTYTGNGSTDGTFVWCGFRPKYVMIKRTDAANAWLILDSERNDNGLWANLSNAENIYDYTDFTANGFKINKLDNIINGSGGTYLFYAIAESPLKYSTAK